MTRDERLLMAELVRVNTQVAGFVLEFTSGRMPIEKQIGFARQLAEVPQQLIRHAAAASNMLDGEVTNVLVEPSQRTLPAHATGADQLQPRSPHP